ncbi:hypothetical protein SEA_EASTWEST_48 [Arthrobacter phage EastWest]|uniref:Uncharacterized protein n=1 Tax=Arthrobacter phage EastWest TaxID=2894292 RepID=A0AAE8YLT9_9CAUD|nr:hypothetical protein SEA_EASTWEST_48 [Arthrobacter phage EastWest]
MRTQRRIGSAQVRRWLRRMDRIEKMSRMHWEAYVWRFNPRPLIHKGGKP